MSPKTKQVIAAILCTMGVGIAIAASDTPSISNTRELAKVSLGSEDVTCANNPVDGGVFPATCTLTFNGFQTTNYTCADVDGCKCVPDEFTVWKNAERTIINVGTNPVTVNDSPGVTEMAADAGVVLGKWDSVKLKYVQDRYLEISRSNL